MCCVFFRAECLDFQSYFYVFDRKFRHEPSADDFDVTFVIAFES